MRSKNSTSFVRKQHAAIKCRQNILDLEKEIKRYALYLKKKEIYNDIMELYKKLIYSIDKKIIFKEKYIMEEIEKIKLILTKSIQD